jgi:hypothetical protein
MIAEKDKNIIRELAKRAAELAALPVNREREQRIRANNSLRPGRPIVWIDEIPWHEMDIDNELVLQCLSPEAQAMEAYFRQVLYRWNHIQADMVVEDTFYVGKAYDTTLDSSNPYSASAARPDESLWLRRWAAYGTLFGISGVRVKEETLSTNRDNHIVSHHYEDQLDTEDKLEKLNPPTIIARPDIDERNLALANDVFDGIMPVKLRGHQIYYAPWDEIAMLRGVTNCYIDMACRPEFTHSIISRFTGIYVSTYEQMEAQGLLDFNLPNLHSTPSYTEELPAKDFDGKIRFKDIWFRGMAQLFASTSPEMQDEFDLQYMRKLMERCGLAYYGCCEPLDKFIPYLKKIPNMRKIGVSPWADVRSSAEQIGGNYIVARKPNPANVGRNFDRETVEKEIAETIEACRENQCPYEFVLKDISTVNNNPGNLIEWTKTVMGVIDRYY